MNAKKKASEEFEEDGLYFGDEWQLVEFQIMGHVVECLEGEPKEEDVLGEFYYADTDAPYTIVASDLAPNIKRAVELHEVVEAWNECLGLELSHGKITAIGEALYQFLQTARYVKGEDK